MLDKHILLTWGITWTLDIQLRPLKSQTGKI
jgi:hypothetical protein